MTLFIGGFDPIVGEIMRALRVPDYARGFSINFSFDDVATVAVKYVATKEDVVSLLGIIHKHGLTTNFFQEPDRWRSPGGFIC